MESVIPQLDAVQYDGSNGAYIASEFLSRTRLGSDDGELLQLIDDQQDPLINRGDWVIRRPAQGGRFLYAGAFSDADYRAMYTVLS
ncbi:hypothetical protein JHN59_13870 [Streptomyces sp. MBT49]|uniref:hypothetical protein n=1 Tax=Streptomyces sp. MBT49 TaxID=1488380 RepID=UPI00190D4BEC|nr:hypothetical protein [Streptomyces sp. MBT49]MBK3625911.1 hypothetical protein [Streptomyces sp. MBT49]